MPRLRPCKYPGNGPQIAKVVGRKSPTGSRPEAQELDQVDGRRLPEVPQEFRGFVHELAVIPPAARRHFLQIPFPLRHLTFGNASSVEKMPVQHSRYELLEIPFRDVNIRVFE